VSGRSRGVDTPSHRQRVSGDCRNQHLFSVDPNFIVHSEEEEASYKINRRVRGENWCSQRGCNAVRRRTVREKHYKLIVSRHGLDNRGGVDQRWLELRGTSDRYRANHVFKICNQITVCVR